MRALLDVNVLIALLDADHVHHRSATDWLARRLDAGWASCPLTQNGCIRVMSQPSCPNGGPPGLIAGLIASLIASLIAGRLRDAMRGGDHAFWPDSIDGVASDALAWQAVLRSRHLTDAYLLALAVRHGGRFVTLDTGVPLGAAVGAAPESWVVLD